MYTTTPVKLSPRSADGFALVIALGLMAFVLLLLLSMTTLVQVESRGAQTQMQRLEAEQAALLGLQVALGELQKTAGPDRRVTATASILDSSVDGNRQLVGVWDTSSVDRFDPANTRQFLGWLVSAPDGVDTTRMDHVQAVVSADGVSGVELFEGKDLSGGTVPEDSIRAALVPIEGGGGLGAYAFSIEDEGVKAKVAWNETTERVDAIDSDLGAPALQRSRLGASAGADFTVFGGPFEDALEFPLIDERNEVFMKDVAKLSSSDQIRLLGVGDNEDWSHAVRHDLTTYSKGLLTDVKNGGFKRDLSLAFEMDGDEDDPNQLSNFNQAIGEFVGGGDRGVDPHSAITQAGGQIFLTRFIFTEDDSQGFVRGGTWHAMRDYYNLYKRIRPSSAGAGYEFDLRPFYPNRSETTIDLQLFDRSRFAMPSGYDNVYAQEESVNNGYRYMPTRGNYTPVLLGYRMAFSVVPVDWDSATNRGGLALAFDPFFYLWNPCDQAIRFENIKIQYNNSMSLLFTIKVKEGGSEEIYRVFLDDYLTANLGSLQKFETFLNDQGEDVVMEPGQVLVFSSRELGATTESWPGPQLTDGSGILLRNHPEAGGAPIPITASSLIDVEMTTDLRNATLPDDIDRWTSKAWFITMSDHVPDTNLEYSKGRRTDHKRINERLQHMFINMASPLEAGTSWDDVVSLADISVEYDLFPGGKYPVGYFDNLMKGTKDNADGSMLVSPFAHFNPTSVFHTLLWRWVPPNRFSYLRAEPSLNAMLPNTINDGESFWGQGYSSGNGASTVPMREIPTSPPTTLASMASANVAPFVFDPMRSIGESNPSPMIPLDQVLHMTAPPASLMIYDSTWLVNDALWDRYFFSGIVPDYRIAGSGYSNQGDLQTALTGFFDDGIVSKHLNTRIQPNLGEGDVASVVAELNPGSSLEGYKRIAEYAVQDGAFNINSTSVDAWAALLRANRDLTLEGRVGNDVSPNSEHTPFPKSAEPLAGDADAWAGYASLSDIEIGQLAAGIVEQVRLRGPFMSLSDFVNRRVESGDLGAKGALQAAIDDTTINNTVGNQGAGPEYNSQSLFPDAGGGVDWGNTASGIGGHLTQADVLKSIGSSITARSDTFRITSYGQREDPISGSVVTAKCEALIQRYPEYIASAENEPEDEVGDLSISNEAFGRRYKIIDFRWLN